MSKFVDSLISGEYRHYQLPKNLNPKKRGRPKGAKNKTPEEKAVKQKPKFVDLNCKTLAVELKNSEVVQVPVIMENDWLTYGTNAIANLLHREWHSGQRIQLKDLDFYEEAKDFFL